MQEKMSDEKKRFTMGRVQNKHELKEITTYDEMQQTEPGQKILFHAPDNPTLQLLEMLPDEDLKTLKDLSCRSCPSSIWMRKVAEIVCWCPIINSVVWRSSKAHACEILICSARRKSDEEPR